MITIIHTDFGWGGLITVQGHSNSAEYGNDVICAGVSTITVTLCNLLDGQHGCSAKFESGNGRVQYLRKKKTQRYLEFALEGYRWLSEAFPDHITFTETRGAG